ncbi:DUF6279 family lipoprotein [Teredinibacter haidensis]|uniref:DUF6279 family lipoprotein n=1 Tax=Teredinibacter haidensis TaxID=2731755 RepID=UPI000948F440|nr:DUF6279 family lipoprotein [Teredinibacter haidensis]
MRKLFKRLGLSALCLLLLNGCATKLAYNFLDFATLWYIESYVNLDRQQKQYAKDYLDTFHDWHRYSQLPRYALYMEGLQLRIATGKMTGQQVHNETDQIQVFLDETLNYLTPMFTHLAGSLSDEQVAELMKSLQKERDQYQKDFVDVKGDKLHKARVDELKSHLSLGLSGFSQSQNQEMYRWSKSLLPFESLTLRQQEIWAEELLAALNKRDEKEQLNKTIRKLLFVHTDHWDEELERRMDKNQKITYDMLATILNSLTQEQRKKMNRKLTGYSTDFRELAVAKRTEKAK